MEDECGIFITNEVEITSTYLFYSITYSNMGPKICMVEKIVHMWDSNPRPEALSNLPYQLDYSINTMMTKMAVDLVVVVVVVVVVHIKFIFILHGHFFHRRFLIFTIQF